MEAAVNDDAVDRRRTPRHRRVQDHGVVSAHVRPGHRAQLVNVSAGGVLVDTACRLQPGASVELQMRTDSRHISIRGRVVRCAVVRLRPVVCYRGAIAFDQHLPWFCRARAGSGYPEGDLA